MISRTATINGSINKDLDIKAEHLVIGKNRGNLGWVGRGFEPHRTGWANLPSFDSETSLSMAKSA